ncbi:MAG TPA: gentisate 1,2-dioxygenase [Geminicoccaceae bacterium]|nr:gentisate 1,2-dioxygenase [Geminicoccaceae bacterium]
MSEAATAPAAADQRRAFYDHLDPHALAPLWEVLRGLVPPEPRPRSVAHAWSYATVRPLLLEAGALLSAEEAERRVLVLENPALRGQSRVAGTMYAGVQLVLPGETAPAHRHTASALRLVLESEGGFTAVAGERTTMRRGDLIITPSWAWHDHGNDGDGPVIWVDGLDIALVNFFEAGFGQGYNDKRQQITRPDGASLARFGSGLLPLEAASPFGATSPIFSYPYARSREAVTALAAAGAPERHLGHTLRYANPLDGGWAMPTIATWLTYLPQGFATEAVRSTDAQAVVVLEGEVAAEIGDRTFTLGESDVLAVPGWTWRRFQAARETILFGFSDRSAQEKLAYWREERR